MRRTLSLSAFVLLAAAPLLMAQQPAPKKGAFDTVIKQATGRNGYEELVMAGDILQNHRRWKQVEADPAATLLAKRQVLAERPVDQALRLLREGLQKPVAAPREQTAFDTATPELTEFLSLARLLALQEYVFLADGRVSDALANARLGLKLGQAVQTDTLLSGLIGVAIETAGIQPVGAHLDQLSARDAETLFAICLEWLRQPSPEGRLMEMEHRNALASLNTLRRESVERLIASTNLDPKPKPDDDDRIRRSRELAADLRKFAEGGPDGIDRLCTDTAKLLDGRYREMVEQLRLPLWQRHYPEPSGDGSLASRLAALLFPSMTAVGNAYAREQARVRVLACHAAVLRFRWEHNSVPKTLTGLNLGELALDPFSGQPLEYQPLGNRYRLVSAGPEAPPDNPRAVNGRLPVSVTPGD